MTGRHIHCRSRTQRFLSGVAVLLVLGGTGRAAAQCRPSFSDGTRGILYAAERPRDVIVADFTGDGLSDLAVIRSRLDISFEYSDLLVLYGRGSGRYEPARVIPLEHRFVSLLADDFGRDGRADLALVDNHSETAAIFLSHGEEGFEALRTPVVSFRNPASSLSNGDFNGDGTPDLLVFHALTGSISLLLGAGGGRFHAGQLVREMTGGPLVGDFNGDGKLDIVRSLPWRSVPGAQYGLAISHGRGDGTFSDAGSYAYDAQLLDFAVADVNGDGRSDLVAAEVVNSVIAVLLSEGNTFRRAGEAPVGGYPSGFFVADFDEDGNSDLVTSTIQGVLSFFPGEGDGGFGASVEIAREMGSSFAASDFDGDAHLDIAVGQERGLLLVLGDGKGAFELPHSPQLSHDPGQLVPLDVDRDGRAELISGGSGGQIISLSPSGELETKGHAGLGGPILSLVTGDFNSDGLTDAVASKGVPSPCQITVGFSSCSPSFSISLGIGAGQFERREIPEPSVPVALAAGDFDGEGRLDLAAAGSGALTILIGDGMGGFRSGPSYPLASDSHRLLLAGHLDGDRTLDLVAAGIGSLNVFLGREGGGLVEIGSLRLAGWARGLLVADFDRDGDNEVAVALYGTDGSSVALFEVSNGRLETGPAFDLPSGANAMVGGDFTGDGLLDVAVAGAGLLTSDLDRSGSVTILEIGRGLRFASPILGVSFATGPGTGSLAALDLDQDGALDLVASNRHSQDLTVLLNWCPPPRLVPLARGTRPAARVLSRHRGAGD